MLLTFVICGIYFQSSVRNLEKYCDIGWYGIFSIPRYGSESVCSRSSVLNSKLRLNFKTSNKLELLQVQLIGLDSHI